MASENEKLQKELSTANAAVAAVQKKKKGERFNVSFLLVLI